MHPESKHPDTSATRVAWQAGLLSSSKPGAMPPAAQPGEASQPELQPAQPSCTAAWLGRPALAANSTNGAVMQGTNSVSRSEVR